MTETGQQAPVVAFVGIDGSGKSAVFRHLEDAGIIGSWRYPTLTCPEYHETPDLPLADLSRALFRLSKAADVADCRGAKLCALYLQMTMFGPIQRFVQDVNAPDVIWSERHALIDAITYSTFYTADHNTPEDTAKITAQLRDEVDKDFPGSWDRIMSWMSLQNHRRGATERFWDLPEILYNLHADLGTADFAAELERRFECLLPEAVIFLDVPADVAIERIRQRHSVEGGTDELHERSATLHLISEAYQNTLASLGALNRNCRTYLVPAGPGHTIDDVACQIVQICVDAGYLDSAKHEAPS